MRLHAEVEVHAPAALVFDVLSTPERLPEWNVSVASACRQPPGAAVGLGSRAAFAGRLLGQTLESETEVVAFDRPRLFATHAIRGPRLSSAFRLDPVPFGTHLMVDISGELPGGKLGELVGERFLRSELAASLDRLRGLCEREARVAASGEPVQGDPACWLHLQD